MAKKQVVKKAKIILFVGDKMLLARKAVGSDGKGLYDFIGGKCDPNETPEQTAKRELSEELAGTFQQHLADLELIPLGAMEGDNSNEERHHFVVYLPASDEEGYIRTPTRAEALAKTGETEEHDGIKLTDFEQAKKMATVKSKDKPRMNRKTAAGFLNYAKVLSTIWPKLEIEAEVTI